MLFVILGSDRALARQALDRQLDRLDPTRISTDRIDGAASTFDAIFAAVTAAPFFSEQRVIVLSGLLGQSAAKGGRGGKAKGETDLSKIVSSVPETNTLILFDPDVGELSATIKRQLPGDVSISLNDAPRGRELVELAHQIANENGASLDHATARAILDRLFPGYWPQAPMNRAFDRPPSVELLSSEIAKLTLAAYPDPITVDLVAEMLPQRAEERVFPLLDAVIGGNQRAALIETENAQRAGEETIRTAAQLYQQIELAVAATAHGRPSDPLQAGRALGLSNANRMRPVTQAAQRARVAPARQLRLALDNDRKLKSGRIRTPEEGLVDLIVRATGQQKTGSELATGFQLLGQTAGRSCNESLASDQGVVLLHEARLASRSVVRVDHATVRHLIERADGIAHRAGGQLGVALANRDFGLLHVGASLGPIWAVPKSLLLGNPDTLLSRFAIRQFRITSIESGIHGLRSISTPRSCARSSRRDGRLYQIVTSRSNAPLPAWGSDAVDEFSLDEGSIYTGGDIAPSAGRSMARNAVIIGVAFMASRVLGLLREIILANRFGTSSEYDAYVSAFRIPDLLFLVIMSGSFGAAFIPVFGGFLARGETQKADRLASAVITWTALTTVVLGLITFAFAGPLMRTVVAPDLPPEAMDLAIQTMRMLLLSPLLLGMGIAAKGILEAHLQFTLPALAPVVYNLAIVLAALFLAPTYGIEGVTVGVLVGALLHVGIQIPGVVRTGLEFRPTLSRNVAGLAEVGVLLLPRVIGQAAFQINFVAVNHFASQTGEGSVSALNYAWQMLMLPNGVLALSISTVVFPTMAAQFELGDIDAFRQTLQRGLRPLLFLLVPASIGLFEFRTSLFQTIFQSGSFDANSTVLASEPLAFLALGLIWYGLVEVLARAFYAMKDTVTPVAAGIFIIVLNIILSKALLDSMGHVGLALSLSVSTGVEAFILMVILRRRIGGFGTEFGVWLSKIVLATAVMALVSALVATQLEDITGDPDISRWVQLCMLGIAVTACAVAYFLAAWLLNISEARTWMNSLRRKVRHLAHIG